MSDTPRATSASIYGVGVTESRKVKASKPRTPSRPRAGKVRTYDTANRPVPRA